MELNDVLVKVTRAVAKEQRFTETEDGRTYPGGEETLISIWQELGVGLDEDGAHELLVMATALYDYLLDSDYDPDKYRLEVCLDPANLNYHLTAAVIFYVKKAAA
ncbi:MAG: hypothetical protein ACM3UO_00285 [Bacillota bacterium]